jgi:hypothetical protein
MRSVKFYIHLGVSALFVFASCTGRNEFPTLKGPYLGQPPPGMTPEVFAPGLISTSDSEKCSGFMNGGNVFVFSRMTPDSDWKYKPTYIMEFRNGAWTKPYLASFNELYPYNFSVAPDDRTLYFTSMRSPDDHDRILQLDNIWVVEKTADGWSDAKMLGPSINSDTHYENYPSVTNDGTVYYMRGRSDGSDAGLYRSRLKNGDYAEAENLGAIVNADSSAADPYIAPDESYLIYCLELPGGYGEYDLYVTFQKKDGSWTEPVNLGGDINSSTLDARPYVTLDGKFLFYYSDQTGNGDIYWVSAKIIDRLRPDALTSNPYQRRD